MMALDTLLVEVLTEELPPKSLARLGQAFAQALGAELGRENFLAEASEVRWFATPRRLAVSISNVLDVAPDSEALIKGPSVKAGLDAEGKPAPALLGFARKRGVPVDELVRVDDGKQEVFAHRELVRGARLDGGLDARVEGALKSLPIPKVMRWGSGEAQFVRPVHGLLMMHGARTIPGTVLGIASGATTRGHRFLGEAVIQLEHADDYERDLEGRGRVIASFSARRDVIERRLTEFAAREDSRLNPGYPELLDEVTALVEWPAVYAGEFEPEYLAVPQECLILTMQQNQKYFPLLDGRSRLRNRFLIVSNMELDDPAHIVGGNQRVVRPRLADAKFFYDQDRKKTLAERVDRLGAVIYHNRLGTQLDRVGRLARVSGAIAARLGADVERAQLAARIAKADLLTDMVGEFPELQGIMGRYYALHDGQPAEVADAIEAHYRPRFAGDALPQGNIACSVALADKLDALVGFFGIGHMPTGDKDPFGLRRAALGVLRILMETPLPLDLMDLLREAGAAFPDGVLQPGFATTLREFVLERLRNLLRESGHAHEPVDAVLALKPTRVDLVVPRVEAVKTFLALPESAALSAANKRIVNILKKAEEKPGEPDVMLLQEEAEHRLFREMNELAPVVRSLVAAEDYTDALCRLASLREAVDHYFDKVMVMAEEPLTRQNRLAMLGQLADLMNQVADLSRLSV